MTPIHGYLSLHQVLDSLFIKWTPNQLMNVNENSKSVNCNHDTEEMDEGVEEDESRYPQSFGIFLINEESFVNLKYSNLN